MLSDLKTFTFTPALATSIMKIETINIKIRLFSNYVNWSLCEGRTGVRVLCATTARHALQLLAELLELSGLKKGITFWVASEKGQGKSEAWDPLSPIRSPQPFLPPAAWVFTVCSQGFRFSTAIFPPANPTHEKPFLGVNQHRTALPPRIKKSSHKKRWAAFHLEIGTVVE